MAEFQWFPTEQDESQRRAEKLFVMSPLFEQAVPPSKKPKTKETLKNLSLLTNPCSPPAWWPPPLSCGCDDGIKCSAVSRWTQLNVAAVKLVKLEAFILNVIKTSSAALCACSSSSIAHIRLVKCFIPVLLQLWSFAHLCNASSASPLKFLYCRKALAHVFIHGVLQSEFLT